MRYLISLFLLLSVNTAQAGSCDTVDLRDQLGPIQNQDGTGLCYAYATSEIVSFKLGKRVSAVDIALQNIKGRDQLMYDSEHEEYLKKITSERQKDIYHGGWVKYALEYSQDAGYCDEDKVNSNDFQSDRDLFRGLANLNQLSLQNYNLTTADSVACSKFAQIQKVFPGVSISEIQNTANNSNIMNVGANMADKACVPRFKPTTPMQFKNLSNEAAKDEILDSSQFNTLDNVLSKKQPIALSVMMNKLYSFGKSSQNSQPRHAMTLAGRKYNPATGKCEYILKNSWGPECDSYFKVRCERGYLFVPEDVLKQVIYAADYIE